MLLPALILTTSFLSAIIAVLLKIEIPISALIPLTASSIDVVFNDVLPDEEKEQLLRKRFLQTLGKVSQILLNLFLILSPFLIIILVSLWMSEAFYEELIAFSISWLGILLAFTGFALVFLLTALFRGKKDKDTYGIFSRALHRAVLDHPNLSKAIFRLDRKWNASKMKFPDQPFLIVCGLARAGSTKLTEYLHQHEKLDSLTYSHMPFVLMPNTWTFFNRPRKSSKQKRKHDDDLEHGYETAEALEEYFWKVSCPEAYEDEHTIAETGLTKEVLQDYLDYQRLVRKDANHYFLAKNNNFLLHYKSVVEHTSMLRMVLMIREPLSHAHSLLRQHQNFSQQQEEDPFTLEYMNWLAHYEFGKGIRSFSFDSNGMMDNPYEASTLDHWLVKWHNFYRYAQETVNFDKTVVCEFSQFCHQPEGILHQIGSLMALDVSDIQTNPYQPTEYETPVYDEGLYQKCKVIYEEICRKSSSRNN